LRRSKQLKQRAASAYNGSKKEKSEKHDEAVEKVKRIKRDLNWLARKSSLEYIIQKVPSSPRLKRKEDIALHVPKSNKKAKRDMSST